MTNYGSMKSMLLFYLNINTVIDQWILVIDNWTKEVQRSIDTTNTNTLGEWLITELPNNFRHCFLNYVMQVTVEFRTTLVVVVTVPCGRAVVITVGMVAMFPDCSSNVIEWMK